MPLFFDISAFLTTIAIAFAALMWASLWKYKYPVPSSEMARIFTIAFLLQLLIYTVFSFFVVDIQVRAYLVRASIVVICLSQSIPLWYSFHAWHKNRQNEL
jgi:hypothetical protein